MNSAILLILSLLSCCLTTWAQPYGKKMLVVIDSLPVKQAMEDWNTITGEDISDYVVIRDKDSLKQLGSPELDAIMYLFTKAYRSRPDSLKRIPSRKQMVYKNSSWYLNDTLYSGPYIDYYNSGRIQNEGTLLYGKVNGPLTLYYKSGAVRSVWNLENGVRHGPWREYYKNGALRLAKNMHYGRLNGVEEIFYLNGQPVYERKYKNATPHDTLIVYFSTGKIREMRLIKNGITVSSKKELERNQLSIQFRDALFNQDLKAANKSFYKIWLLDSTNIDTYYKEGLLLASELRFEEAIERFDRVLQIEPFQMNAVLERGLSRLKKYHPSFQKHNIKEKKELFLTPEAFNHVPDYELKLICEDLVLADELDATESTIKRIVSEQIFTYCRNVLGR